MENDNSKYHQSYHLQEIKKDGANGCNGGRWYVDGSIDRHHMIVVRCGLLQQHKQQNKFVIDMSRCVMQSSTAASSNNVYYFHGANKLVNKSLIKKNSTKNDDDYQPKGKYQLEEADC